MARGGTSSNRQDAEVSAPDEQIAPAHRHKGQPVRHQHAPSPELVKRVRAARSVVVLTGAGISTESGLPDFRGQEGLWNRMDPIESSSTIGFRKDPNRIWQLYVDGMEDNLAPNAGHEAIARLQKAGCIDFVITQNVDGLHERAGSPEQSVLTVHGDLKRAECHRCGESWPLAEAAAWRDGAKAPLCPTCAKPLQPSLVLFGQKPRGLDRARELLKGADVVICLGTSLQVEPVASLPRYARRHRAYVVIVTDGPTPYDDRPWWRDERVHARLGSWLTALADGVLESSAD
jgi:NAD-dependent deacetylase